MKIFFSILFFVLSVSIVSAQTIPTFYVKTAQDGGSDTNTGTSWDQAFETIQTAIDIGALYGNAQVWVAKGTYHPTLLTNPNSTDTMAKAIIMKPGVMLYGGFVGNETDLDERDYELNETIISSDINGDDTWVWNNNQWIVSNIDDNYLNVILFSGEHGSFNLRSGFDGFTITGAKSRSGIYARDYEVSQNTESVQISPMICNNKITRNISTIASGGIAFIIGGTNNYSNTIIAGNKIYNNKGGGASIRIHADGSISLHNSIIIEKNEFFYNSGDKGGGLYTYSSSYSQTTSFLISDNTFYNNYANEGGGMYLMTSFGDSISYTIQNNLIYNNTANWMGGGVEIINFHEVICNFVMRNNLIVNNRAIESCGGGFLAKPFSGSEYGSVVIELKLFNNIIWGNRAPVDNQIHNNENAYTVNMHHCAIEDGFSGIGLSEDNILIDTLNDSSYGPQFINPSNTCGIDENTESTDWHYSNACSPCVDAGSNQFTQNLYQDFDANPRIYNSGTVDIGPYEFQGVHPDFNVSISGTETACPNDAILLNSSVSGGTPPYSYLWSNNDTENNTQDTGCGIYSLTVTDLNNCAAISNYNVQIAPADFLPNNQRLYIASNGICSGHGSSWEDALAPYRIQEAIDYLNSQGGGEIWVAEGTYHPTDYCYNDISNFRSKAFIMKPKVSMYGGFNGTEISLDERDINENSTILDGNTLNSPNDYDFSFHVVLFSSEYGDFDSTCVLDGFIIQNGCANGISPNDIGGGVFLNNNNQSMCPIIRNCTIRNNKSTTGGSGIACEAFGTLSNMHTTISNNYFTNNNIVYSNIAFSNSKEAVIAIVAHDNANINIHISASIISNNSGTGLSISATDGSYISSIIENNYIANNLFNGIALNSFNNGNIQSLISHNNIYSNGKEGILNYLSGNGEINTTITKNIIAHHKEFYSRAIKLHSSGGTCNLTISNNRIFDNEGGGIHAKGSLQSSSFQSVYNITINNNLIYNNTCQNDGGGILLSNSQENIINANITNNTLVNNKANSVPSYYSSDAIYCLNTNLYMQNNIVWQNTLNSNSLVFITNENYTPISELYNNALSAIIENTDINENFYLLDTINMNPLGPHFKNPSTFLGQATNAEDSAALHLVDFSIEPCTNSIIIDNGNNAFVDFETDIDGNLRIMNDTVDLGAYESDSKGINLSGNMFICGDGETQVNISFSGIPPFYFIIGSDDETEDYSSSEYNYELLINTHGNYFITLIDSMSCEEISYTESFTINSYSIDTVYLDTLHVCEDSDLLIDDVPIINSGNYYQHLIASTGCDSILEIPVVVHPLPELNISTIHPSCGLDNGSANASLNNATGTTQIYWSNGETANEITNLTSGYYFCTASDNYCVVYSDAIILNDIGGPEISFTGDTAICYNEEFQLYASGAESYVWENITQNTFQNGATYSGFASENQILFLSGTTDDCNSSTQVSINILPTDTVFINSSICEGSDYLFVDTLVESSGSYTRTLLNQFGCDSIVNLELEVINVDTTFTSVNICEGESYLFEGSVYSLSGDYAAIYQSEALCDSVVLLSLNVAQPPEPPVIYQIGDTLFSSYSYGNVWYRYNAIIPNATSDTLIVNHDGSYFCVHTDFMGCTSLPSNYIQILHTPVYMYDLDDFVIYPNPTSGIIYLEFPDSLKDSEIFVYDCSGRLLLTQKISTEISLNNIASGLYVLYIESVNGKVLYKKIRIE
jgi:hypothetical protein